MGAFDDLVPPDHAAAADPAGDAFADLIPATPGAGAFDDLIPPSPTAPAAPGTPGPASDPFASAVPALAAAPPVTHTELTALARVLGVSPETAAMNEASFTGPVNTLAPLPEAAPELRDASTGFLNNLSVRDLINAPKQGAAAGVMKYLTGNTDAEVAKRRRALGQDVDPIEREFNAALEAAYQAGGYESPDYQRLDQAAKEYQAAIAHPSFSGQELLAALRADPGGMAAEFVKAVAADPELLVTPLGWSKAAAAAGTAAKAAGAGRALAAAAKIAGGATGAAATGAAVTAPVSAGVQLGETGSVDFGRTVRETAIGAGASSGTAGVFVGLGAGVRALRKLRTKPGVDAAAVDAEIADILRRTETEAGKAGMTPEAARAELERFAVDIEPQPEGGAVVRPRTDVLEGLPGETATAPSMARGPSERGFIHYPIGEPRQPATHTMPDGTEMPGATHGELAPAAPPTVADLETRLANARRMAAQPGNGDIRSEWERTAADLEEQIARAAEPDTIRTPTRETADTFTLREPAPDELPTTTTTTPDVPGRPAAAVPEPRPELYLPERAPDAEHLAATQALGPGTRHVRTGTFPSALQKVTSAADVAHAMAPLRREAQESMLAVATDADGQVLRVARLFKGTHAEAAVDPGLVAGAMANTPGAKRAWFVHNHPSGAPIQTDADRVLTERLHELLRGSGVEPQGMLALAPGGRFTHFRPGVAEATGEVVAAIPAGRRTERLPVTERQLASGDTPGAPIDTPEQLRAAFGEREGVLLLDNQKRALRFVPLSAEDMAKLRQGEGGASQRLLAAFDETPTARAFAARTSAQGDEARRVAGNLDGFARVHGTPLVDALDGAGESLGKQGNIPEQSTFYANPFLYAVGQAARDIGRNTGRNLTASAAGGALAGVSSNEEAGSAKWWVDVAAGATAGIVGSQFLRSTRLLGKGSIVDNWRGSVGAWLDSLPLIGRGPEELRALKGKQRLMQDYLDRQTAEVGKQLLENFTPAERAMMADLIETRGIVKDLNVIHRQAQALDDYLTTVAQKMKDLGMLPPDLEEGGYLHRYYAKHLGLDKLFKEAKGQSLSGSYTIARGTDDVFGREFLSPGVSKVVDEFEKLKDSAKVLSADQARLRELGKIEFVEYMGLQNGKLRSFLFARDEVPRVDTGTKPVLAQLYQSKAPAQGTNWMAPLNVTDLKPTNYVWTVRGTKGKEALMHRDWTKYERQSWGEIEDAGYRYVRGMTEASHDLSLATLFDTIARKREWVSFDKAPPIKPGEKPWVFVPKTKVGPNSPLEKYGMLAGKYVRPDIWAGIKGYGRNPLRGGPKIPLTGVGLGDAYLAGLNKWKLYKTVYNPVTHFNNTYSNVEMLYMGGYSPAEIARGVKHLSQGDKSAVWREARDAGLFGSDWTTSLLSSEGSGNQALADLAEKLRTQPAIPDAAFTTSLVMDLKQWWIKSGNALDQADGAWKTGAALAEAMGKPLLAGVGFTTKPIKAAGRAMQRAYRFEDNLFKMAVFAAERAKGTKVDDALQAAQNLFFDYQDLPEAMKLVRDLPVGAPFISYPYFAVQAIARNAAQNPERVLMLVAGYEAWNYAVLTAQGMAPGEYWATESAESATSPPWDRGRALWGARNTVHMPFMEGYRVALGRAHAMGNPFMTEAGGREKLPEMPAGGGVWGSSIFGGSPLHALLDVSVNEDWKGKEIYKPGAPKEEKAQKIAAYLYQAWAPSNPLTPGGYQQTKVIEGLANDVRKARAAGKDPGVIGPVVDAANATAEALGFGQFTGLDRADNEIVTRDALLASFGVKLRPIRVEQSVEFETGKGEKEKKKAADWFKERSRLNADGRITDAQFAEDEKAFDEALDRINQGQDQLFDAEAFLRKRTTTPRSQP